MRTLAYILLLLPLAAFGQDISKINEIPIEDILLVDSVAPGDAARIWSGTPNLIPWWVVDGDTAEAAYLAKGAADYSSSLIDLTGNGNNVIVNNAPSWNTIEGWVFDGVADWIQLPFKYKTSQTTGHAFLIKFSDVVNTGTNEYITGNQGAASIHLYIFSRYGSSGHRYSIYASGSNVAGNLSSGIVGVTGSDFYLNGVREWDFNSGYTMDNYLSFGQVGSTYTELNIQAIVYFTKPLSNAQMIQLTEQMSEL